MGSPTTVAATSPSWSPVNEPGDLTLLRMVQLPCLMALTSGASEVVVGLIDGPVDVGHPALASSRITPVADGPTCQDDDAACVHGTFVAGVLVAQRGTAVPAVCPGCTLLLRPIFGRAGLSAQGQPSALPDELAAALVDCLEAGAHIVNVSAALTEPRAPAHAALTRALDLAARRGVLVVTAAGNQAVLTGSALTWHPWVIPVVAYDRAGRPLEGATLGRSIGHQGVGAPGEDIPSLAPGGGTARLSGSSAAAPLVTGAAALIRSRLPTMSGAQLRSALLGSVGRRGRGVVPPLFDAWAAHATAAAAAGEG